MNPRTAKQMAEAAGYRMWYDRSQAAWVLAHDERDTSYIPGGILREMTTGQFARAYLEGPKRES